MTIYEKKKLTIRVDSQLIEKAKAYASDQNTSISKLVELFLSNLIDNTQQEASHSELVNRLSGILPKDLDVELLRENHLKKKYDV